MVTYHPHIDRASWAILARFQRKDNMKRNDLAKNRSNHDDGSPVIPLEDALRAEVQRCEARLEAARRDLRNFLLSRE